MPAAGGLFNALLALAGWALAFTLFGTAMIWSTLKFTDAGKVKAAVQKERLGGGSGLGQRPSVTGIRNKQTNSNSLQNPGSIDRTGTK